MNGEASTGRAPLAVSARGVSHAYHLGKQKLSVLENINLSIPRERIVSIVGPSGCGKTTLLNIIAGLFPPSSGEIQVMEADPSILGGRGEIGFIMQEPALLAWLSVERNVQVPAELIDNGRKGKNIPVEDLLQLVKLKEFRGAFPSELSGGMKSRVAIARALVTRPPILLMDEPFGALDEITSLDVATQLLSLWGIFRPTVVMVTHNINHAVLISDEVIVMSSRPGSIRSKISVDLPRPRDMGTLQESEFYAKENEVRQSLYSASGRAP